MAYLEYPKALYLDGDTSKASTVVQNAEQEEAAAREGFQPLPANPPPEPAQPGGAAFLEFPKMLYQGGALGADTRVVKDAAAQEAAAADGFLPLAAADAAHDDDEPKHGRSRKKK